MKGAHLVEVYTDNDGAQTAAAEWRTSGRVEWVRVVKHTVRALGGAATVFVVCCRWVDAVVIAGK